MKKIVTLGLGAALLVFQNAKAKLIWDEQFNYPNGVLTTVSSGNWTAYNGGGTLPVHDTGGVITLTNTSGTTSGEDLSRSLGATYTTGTLYVSLLVSMNVASTSSQNGDYFASFLDNGSMETRIFASELGTSGTWTFGLNADGTTPTDWGTALALNTFYNITLKFDLGTGAVSMGVFAANASPSSDADLTLTDTTTSFGIESFGLRQGSGVKMSENIDDIKIGTTLADVSPAAVPEPSTTALAAFGTFTGLLVFRRRR